MPPVLETKIDAIREAISNIEEAHQKFLDCNMDPGSSQNKRDVFRWRFEGAKKDFSYQWENVRDLLAEFDRTGK